MTTLQAPAPSVRNSTLPAHYPCPSPPVLRRFSVGEYHRLIAQGFFARDEKFELLNGFIVAKMARDPVHDAILELAQQAIAARLPVGWRVRTQCAITIATADSEPEPDLAMVRGEPRDYLARHPGPPDLAMVAEVANTSLVDDRDWKTGIYAQGGIVRYWIINLIDYRIEVYSDPSGPDSAPAYRKREDYAAGQSVPLVIDGAVVASIAIADLLPPRP